MTLIGAARHSARLRKLKANAKEIGAVMYEGADMIRVEAKQLITKGSVSGKGHVPSAPHEPPNRDTGHLDTNIEAARTGPLTAETRATADYALPLELGTSKMVERPFMRPATKRTLPKIVARVDKKVKQIIERS